jgi:hypothetical protein
VVLRICQSALAARVQKGRFAASRDPNDHLPAIAQKGEPHLLAAHWLESCRVLTRRALLAHSMEICRGFQSVDLFSAGNGAGSEELFTPELALNDSSHADAEIRRVD